MVATSDLSLGDHDLSDDLLVRCLDRTRQCDGLPQPCGGVGFVAGIELEPCDQSQNSWLDGIVEAVARTGEFTAFDGRD